jgi:hypothetical protein
MTRFQALFLPSIGERYDKINQIDDIYVHNFSKLDGVEAFLILADQPETLERRDIPMGWESRLLPSSPFRMQGKERGDDFSRNLSGRILLLLGKKSFFPVAVRL